MDKKEEMESLFQQFEKYIDEFRNKPDTVKRQEIISSIIFDIQSMQKIIKSLDPDAEDILNLSEDDFNDEDFLVSLYLLVVKLQFTFANMNNKIFGALETDNEMIEELHNGFHK